MRNPKNICDDKDCKNKMQEPVVFVNFECVRNSHAKDSFMFSEQADVVISEFATLPKESSFSSFGQSLPMMCIRASTEWSETIGRACFMLAGIDTRNLMNAVRADTSLTSDGTFSGSHFSDYTTKKVSTEIIKVAQSYTGIVDEVVWNKSVNSNYAA